MGICVSEHKNKKNYNKNHCNNFEKFEKQKNEIALQIAPKEYENSCFKNEKKKIMKKNHSIVII